jgi:hypothetical protein
MSSLQKALARSQDGSSSNGRTRKKPQAFAPTITTVDDYSSSSGDDNDSSSSSDDSSVDSNEEQRHQKESADMIKIRQQALDLLNTPSTGPHAAAASAKSKSNQRTAYVSSYQQSAGERSTGLGSPHNSSSYQSSSTSSYAMHDPRAHPRARMAEELSVKEMLVNCVSEVCKSSSSEIIQKVFSAGYKSVSNYGDPPIHGDWGESIDTSQHGYGNRNNNKSGYGNNNGGIGNMPSRYQD